MDGDGPTVDEIGIGMTSMVMWGSSLASFPGRSSLQFLQYAKTAYCKRSKLEAGTAWERPGNEAS